MTLAFLWMGLDMGTVRSLVTAWRFSVIQATSCKARTPSHVYGWKTDSIGSLTLRRVSVGEHYTVYWFMWSDVKYSWPLWLCWRTGHNNCVSEHRTLISMRSKSRLLCHLCEDANHSLSLNLDFVCRGVVILKTQKPTGCEQILLCLRSRSFSKHLNIIVVKLMWSQRRRVKESKWGKQIEKPWITRWTH